MLLSQLTEGVRIALESLRANKLRTFLTLLGNIVGTMSVIAVVSLLDGIDIYAREKVLDEGSGVFSIQRVNVLQFVTDVDAFIKSFYNPRLTTDDVRFLEKRVPSAAAIDAEVSVNTRVSYHDEWIDGISVEGRTEVYPFIDEMELEGGRHLARLDVTRSKPSVVLGYEVAEALFGDNTDPLGHDVKIAGKHFQVVGVVEERGAVMGSSRDRFAVIPVSTWLKLFNPRQSVQIQVKAHDITLVEDAIDEATVAMRIRHRLRPTEDDDFSIVTSAILLGLWAKIESYIRYVLVAAVSISLLVGGIVLMNVMLVAVTDRTREIGVRKALGATRMAVLWQFIIEAVTLSMIGGFFGISIGFLIAVLVSAVTPLPYSIQPIAAVLGVSVTFILGIIFGTFPANKASRLDPVEALRRE